MAQTPRPTVDVPTREEFDALVARVVELERETTELDSRVDALEGVVTTPPDPVVPPEPGVGEQAQRIADAIGLFGVNTFSSLDDGNMWGSWPADYRPEQVIAAIRYMVGDTGHAFRIREYHYAGREGMQRQWLQQIQAAIPNTMATICVGANGSVADVPTLLSMHDLLVWVEGLNEPNTDFGSGQVAVSQTMDIQNRLWADAQLLVVMGPSVVAGMPHPEGWITGYFGDQMGACNAALHRGNGHYYPPHCPDLVGDGTSVPDYVGGLWTAYGNHPIDLTEFHPTLYNSDGNKPDQPGWSGERDAYYTLLTLLRSAKCGVTGLWWYALFDYGQTYLCGLFPTNASNPRPAADALRRLCHACPDTGGDARSFAPGKVEMACQLGERCDYLLAQASDGMFYLFLWHSEPEAGGQPHQIALSFSREVEITETDLLSGATRHYPAAQGHLIEMPATVRVLAFR